MNKKITVEATVEGSPEKVWACWTEPDHITKWAFASDDWECPKAENDVKIDGRFVTTMSAKDKSTSFDFGGVYTAVENQKYLAYAMDDGRTASISFSATDGGVHIVETFEMELENTEELQRNGWQSILNNFKAHVESPSN